MIPSDIMNRAHDALERAAHPPQLYQARAETRVAIERDYRAIEGHLRCILAWLRRIESVTLRDNSK